MFVEYAPLIMFAMVCGILLLGYPVALSLGGTALICAYIGTAVGHFDFAFFNALPNRLFGVMTNQTLIAVPLFVPFERSLNISFTISSLSV